MHRAAVSVQECRVQVQALSLKLNETLDKRSQEILQTEIPRYILFGFTSIVNLGFLTYKMEVTTSRAGVKVIGDNAHQAPKPMFNRW